MNCGTETCNEVASYRVHWPGQTIELCEQCNARAHKVADAMGFALRSELIAPAELAAADARRMLDARPRKPYAAPAIEESGNFERLVLACTHRPGGDIVCTSGQPQS